jgi:hypothetical protein
MKRTILTSAALTAFGLLCTPSFTWAQNTQPPAVTAQDGGAFSRARKAYADGDLATARTEMEKAIAALPEDADANASRPRTTRVRFPFWRRHSLKSLTP